MSTIFLWFHGIKKRLGSSKGFISLVVLWLGFEWLHYNWDLSHPWSTFGNTFANHTWLIQWYEYTGALGGSLWVLMVNILVFILLQNLMLLKESLVEQKKLMITIIGLLIIPTIVSMLIYSNYTETN
ncbi:MAG TPA: apolipoprotein N-acyltransferase, partial [Vicingus sp.]|nr:apolipoprotein N-acyltransferase [Vicingus sp.]